MSSLATKAANWWREQLSIDGVEKYSPNDPNNVGAIFNYILQDKFSKEQLDIFVNELTKEIDEALSSSESISLRSRWYPCNILERCGNIAGFSGLSFPWQTFMIITKDSIRVKDNMSIEYTILE